MIDPLTGAALASSAAGLITSIFAGGDDGGAKEYLEKAAQSFSGLQVPDLLKPIQLLMYQQGGTLTPEQRMAIPEELQPYIELIENPEARAKQLATQQALERLAQTGMGAQERLALKQVTDKSAQDLQRSLAGIQQKYQEMGTLGGPMMLAAQLSGAQQASQNEAMQNMQAAAMAAENRRNALMQAASGASRLREQDYNVASSNIEAQRRQQEFNARNAIARTEGNLARRSEGNLYNLQRAQAQMDKNIAQQNQQLFHLGYTAPNQMFQNQMAKASGMAGVYGKQGDLAQQQAQAQAQGMANVFGGIGSLGLSYGGLQAKNQQNALKAKSMGYQWDDDTNDWKSYLSNA